MEFQPDEYAQKEAALPTPWGFWPTIGFLILTFVISAMAITILIAVFVSMTKADAPGMNVRYYTHHLVSSGMFLSVGTIATTPLMIGMVLLFVKLKKGITVTDYLVLRKIDFKTLLKWIGFTALFIMASDIATYLLGKPIVPINEVNIYKTAISIPLLWMALLIAAPISEEILFRGFLFKGIKASRIGVTGAIVICSLIWSALHVQYDFWGVAQVFISGLVLGYARYKTSSIYTPIAIHSFMNLVATCEVAFL